jgi:hypothetical protein
MKRKSGQTKQLSLRGFDDELERRICETARCEGISMNRAALQLLRRGAGMRNSGKSAAVVGDSLDNLIGQWSPAEARKFSKSIQPLEQIDETFWK